MNSVSYCCSILTQQFFIPCVSEHLDFFYFHFILLKIVCYYGLSFGLKICIE